MIKTFKSKNYISRDVYSSWGRTRNAARYMSSSSPVLVLDNDKYPDKISEPYASIVTVF